MKQLDLLKNLEAHHRSLILCHKEFDKLDNDTKLKDTEKKIKLTEDKIEELSEKQNSLKEKLKDSNEKLNEYTLKINEIEIDLYKDGTDFKILESLNHEKEMLKEIIDSTETEILDFMEEFEKGESNLEKIKDTVAKVKQQVNDFVEKQDKLRERILDRINLEEIEILKAEELVDEDILNEYNKLMETKGTALALVKNQTCTGCNMMLPSMIIDKLREGNEMISCDSCGRILYTEK